MASNSTSPAPANEVDLRAEPSGSQRIRFGCALLALLLLWLIIALYLLDVPPPKDHDLQPRWSDVPEEQNPLATFGQEYRATRVRSSETRNLDANQHVLVAFDKLLATAPTTWRWRGIGPDAGPDYLDDKTHPLQPALHKVVNITALVQKRSLQPTNEGNPDKAADGFLDLLTFFQGLEGAEGQLPQHMTVMDLRRRLLHRMEAFLTNPSVNLPPATMGHIAESLQKLEPSRAGLQFTLRAEYELASHRIRQWVHDSRFLGRIPDRPRAIMPNAQFKPNLTLVAYGWRILPVLEGLEDGWPAVHRQLADVPPLVQKQAGPRSMLPELGLNATGAQVLHFVETGSEVLVGHLLEQVVTMRLMTLQLALRQFEEQHHHLPRHLSELSPAILSTLPIDPGTGKPFPWNPLTQTLSATTTTCKESPISYWWRSHHNPPSTPRRLSPPWSRPVPEPSAPP